MAQHPGFGGPYLSKMCRPYLVIVDAFSKFVNVVPVGKATTANTIATLRLFLASLVYLNIWSLTVEEVCLQVLNFRNLLKKNDIEHTLTAPGHPATKGLSERYVGEFSDKLSIIGDTG